MHCRQRNRFPLRAALLTGRERPRSHRVAAHLKNFAAALAINAF
jgi:hypothetical protein